MEISLLPSDARVSFLLELAVILAQKMNGISRFAQNLVIDKSKHREEFDSILFDFLLPLHDALIHRGAWDEALELEVVVYAAFIKQDENHDFYERAFSKLYYPYQSIFNATVAAPRIPSDSTDTSRGGKEGAMLFWFQSYSVFAHTQLVLDLATHMPVRTKLYASALNNIDLNSSRPTFAQAGIELLPIDDRQSVTARCNELIQLCKSRKISNVVLVSVPLQSGYLKRICEGIALTWWSMKYPLGCMPHFDRLVCNRTLYPTQKVFHGALWQCAPFALKALPPNPEQTPLGTKATDLNIGVLSREEKFASSDLPEILHNSLSKNTNIHLFWTGRKHDLDLASRLNGSLETSISHQVHFAGWVDPATFLTQVDLLVDTPNLGGIVAYWAMSMGKVVISASDAGSIGALGSRQDLQTHFQLLSCTEDVKAYFATPCLRPYYLSDGSLIPICLAEYVAQRALLKEHGQRFFRFFIDVLSDMERWSLITYQMLKGSNSK